MNHKLGLGALALMLLAALPAVAVEDGLGTNHVRTLKAHDGIVLDNLRIGSWADVGASTLTNDSIRTTMIQDGAVTTGKIAAAVAGAGLIGGDAAPLEVGAGDGIAVTADAVAVDASVVRTNGVQTIGGTNTFEGQLNVPAPTAATHAATKQYIDTKLSSAVAAGASVHDTLRWNGSAWTNSSLIAADASGNLSVGGTLAVAGAQTNASDLAVLGRVTLAGPVSVSGAQTNAGDLVVQGRTVLGDAGADPILFVGTGASDLNMGATNTVTGLKAPAANSDAATKQYVDNAINGLSWKQAVRAATTGHVAALTSVSAGNTLDAVALLAGDRVLIKNQSSAVENGIYEVQGAGLAPVRAADMTHVSHLGGAAVFVAQGSIHGGSAWVCTSPTATVGSQPLTFAQFASPGVYTAGDGMNLAGLEFSADPADFTGAGLEVNGGDIRLAAAAAGDGLTGGAGIAMAVGAGDGLTVTADAVAVNASVVRTNGVQTIGGTNTFEGQLNVPVPTAASHAVTKQYVDTKLSSAVAAGASANDTLRWNGSAWTNSSLVTADASGNMIVGGTLGVTGAQTNAGDLVVQGNTVLGSAGSDSITFAGTSASDLNMGTAHTVTGLKAPAADNDAATKQYVDNAINGLSWKTAVKAATTNSRTLSADFENGDILDGVGLATGDRILVKNQGTAAQNGIYVVQASGTPSRATDLSSSVQLAGAAVFVAQGTVNGGSAWVCTTPGAAVGTEAIGFAQFASPGVYSAGDGMNLAGLEFSADPADFTGAGLEVNGGDIRLAAAAAGDGLTGGAGIAMAVGAGDGLTVTADAVAVNASVVRTNGVQTIGGTNTFEGQLNVPVPTAASHAVTKQYVDTKLSSAVAAGASANDTLRWNGSAWTNSPGLAVDASGNATLGGTLGVAGAMAVTGAVAVASTAASTDKDTGALVVEGGAGIEGSLHAGGNAGVAGDLAVGGQTVLGNDIASDTVSVTAKVTFAGAVVAAPSGEIQVAAATGITAAHVQRTYLKVRGNSGAVDLSANPQIAAGAAGQMLTLQGTDDTNTLKLDDGNGLALAGGVSFTLKAGHIIQFLYDGSVWRELFRTVPAP